MSTSNISNFLRRTAVALAAAAFSSYCIDASAQSTVTLSTGGSCSYQSMSVQPNGNVNVTCTSGAPTPGLPGNFSVSAAGSIAVSTSTSVTVFRNGGNTGASTVSYSVSGGCSPASGQVSFADAGGTSNSFTLTAPAAAGSCTVSLTGVSGVGTLGSPTQAQITISGGSSNPPAAGCPAVPSDVKDFTLKLSGSEVQRLASGQIASSPLATIGIQASGVILLAETTSSPQHAVVEISISKCRGEIKTDAGACYLKTDNPSLTSFTWLERENWGSSTAAIAEMYGLCQAYTTNGPFYVNMRYTYNDCSIGTCGFVSQWNYGPW